MDIFKICTAVYNRYKMRNKLNYIRQLCSGWRFLALIMTSVDVLKLCTFVLLFSCLLYVLYVSDIMGTNRSHLVNGNINQNGTERRNLVERAQGW